MTSSPVLMIRPRVKPEHAPYRITGGNIRIGGVSFGLAAEIADPDGWVWTMLSAMDGTRDLPEIIKQVSAAHPGQPVTTLERGARQLLGSGYVEDVAAPVPAALSDRDIRRYDRAMGYFRWLDLTPRQSSWEPQALLRRAKVTILGVGGTGGTAALALAASGIGHLHCVDPDVVELSNLSRQVIYGEDDIGRPKADSAVARLRRLNGDIKVTGQRMEAACSRDVLGLSRDCDVLLLSADKPPELRTWTNRACLAARRPWVDSGYHGPLVQAGAFIPGQGPCWECVRLRLRDGHARDGADPRDAPHRQDAVAAAVGAVPAGMSGYLAAHLVIALLTGVPRVVPGRIETVNMAALDAPLASGYPPHPDCPACGPRGSGPRGSGPDAGGPDAGGPDAGGPRERGPDERGPRPGRGRSRAMAAEAVRRAGSVAPGTAAAVRSGSRVRLHPLAERRDGEGWVIGRVETGDFIAVPDVAHRVVALLGQGHAVDEVAARLRAETGKGFAVTGFVAALDDLGFVAAIDDQARPDAAAPRPSLRWLRPGHVRWLLHPLMAVLVAGFAVVAVVVLASHPALLPSYRMLVWNRHAGMVLAVNAAIAWTLIVLHELAHLATARAAGAPARITISTRLQFLAAQTDVSGVWAAPRRYRMTVYLAGMALNLCLAAACLLVLVAASPHGLPRALLCVVVAETALALPTQFMVFMRTDLYFVLQDLTRCANLYADGSAYLRHLARRVIHRGARPNPDPSQDYPPAQRRAVRAYSVILLVGTAVCLGVEFAVSLPALVVLVVRAVAELGTTVGGTLDGAVLIAVLLAWQVIWCTRWWARHQGQVRSLAGKLRKGGTPDGGSDSACRG